MRVKLRVLAFQWLAICIKIICNNFVINLFTRRFTATAVLNVINIFLTLGFTLIFLSFFKRSTILGYTTFSLRFFQWTLSFWSKLDKNVISGGTCSTIHLKNELKCRDFKLSLFNAAWCEIFGKWIYLKMIDIVYFYPISHPRFLFVLFIIQGI